MARVVVVGGGLGGLAAAVRLAKTGHAVTLLEASPVPGGAARRIEATSAEGAWTWDAGPTHTLLPAVLRDLFRKSGRPLEAELDLHPLDVVREHRFDDGSVLSLPGGSRAAQVEAFDGLRPGLGAAWASYVERGGEDWDLLRRHVFETSWTGGERPREVTRLLETRESLARRVRRALRDERARLVATHPATAAGHPPRDVPGWWALVSWLEQRFGAWAPVGGMAAVTDALERRLATRRVEVHTGTPVADLVVRQGRVAGVTLASGETVDADVVVVAVDPRRLPTLAPAVERTLPALPPVVCHVGLVGEVPDLPHEVVVHGDPEIVVRPGGSAPEGGTAWTVHARGRLAEDVLDALARHRIDVRRQVVARVDRSARVQVEELGGSPYGVLWQGRATVRRRLGPDTPVPGVWAVGAAATHGPGVPFVGLTAAVVAERIGPA